MDELPAGFLSISLGHGPVPTPMAPPALLDENVEEILLRVPPDDPARLLRCALVCKGWARLLADRGFLHRYCERHGGRPPLLGFVANKISTGGNASFVRSLDFSPPLRLRGYRAHDARHGRVLLNQVVRGDRGSPYALAVWDPVTDEHQSLPLLLQHQPLNSWNAAVLCAGPSCYCHPLDYRCRLGHFLVAFVGMDANEMFAHVYSSESVAWGERTSAQLPGPGCHFKATLPGALARNALYFVLGQEYGMVKYDLATGNLSLVALPHTLMPNGHRLMTLDDGGLGCAELDLHATLKLWSMVIGPEGDEGHWAVRRVIDLGERLPFSALVVAAYVAAVADVIGVVFIWTSAGLYTFDVKTGQSTRVMNSDFYSIVPYTSFYTPVLR